ncbi:MAG TPA: sulfotransferase [Rhizomicrobium sp.]|jgi:tetratricopeptide (TPR) repeat protein
MTPDTVVNPPDPQTVERLQEILSAGRAGNHQRAADLAGSAIEDGVRHPLPFRVRAAWHIRHKRFEEALEDLQSLSAFGANDPMAYDMVGHCLTMLNRPHEAVQAFDAAILLAPNLPEIHFHRAIALGVLNQTEAMRGAFESVIALKADHTEALAGLAFLVARAGEAQAARSLGERALARDPRQASALVALAIADMIDGEHESAARKLDDAVGRPNAEGDGRLNMALGFAADAWDRQGRPQDAFALYTTLNDRRRDRHAAHFAENRAVDDVRRQIAYFARSNPWPPARDCPTLPGRPDGHVFLLSFVRSGTTLLETVLASHPGIVAIDEIDFLADAAHAFLESDSGLDELATLDDQAIDQWRHRYWSGAAGRGVALAGKVFVDKLPFNSLRLPLIARLFPTAKVILAVRDPRDVVFSTFRHRFNIYPSSFEFLRLDDCAQYYSAVMELVAVCRNKLPIALREHRYEDMVADFETAVRAICVFLGIEWTDRMLKFGDAARGIDRRSQSARQVSQGLYQGGAGQWRRYHAQLAPVLPVLAPWVERFGYPPE